MRFEAIGSAVRATAISVFLAGCGACTTYVPLADDYGGPYAWPEEGPSAFDEQPSQPIQVATDVEARTRAHFVVRQLELPPVEDSTKSIAFEYYDVDGDARTPVVMLLPIFNGQLAIPRFFARYFANAGLAAVVVKRGRDPLEALTAPNETIEGNLQDYRRVLDWIEQEPELDASRIGVFGVSLGAMDAVMLAGLDQRVNSLVIAMAGGDLSYLLANTNYRRVARTIDDMADELGMTRELLGARLDAAMKLDPLEIAPYIDAERVFMILTRTDAIVPFEAQQRLRDELGSPEALYLLTGHRLSVVFFPKLRNAAFEFFARRFGLESVAFNLH